MMSPSDPAMKKPSDFRILIACESSATVREAFKARGFNAWSCDLLPTDIPGNHIQGDALAALGFADWDLVIAHPPCTYLTVTGNKWFKPEFAERFPTRHQDREDAMAFFMRFTKCRRFAIENPVGIVSTRWRKPDQIVHPFHFGDPHSKATCLWIKGVPKLTPTKIVEPQFYTYKDGRRDPIWHVESMKLPAHERMRVRSKTWPGMAEAMAQQWGDALLAEGSVS